MSHYSPLALAIATLLILLPSSYSTTPLVAQTCKQISDSEKGKNLYNVCVTFLGSDHKSETATTVADLGVIAFNLLQNKAVATKEQILALSQSSKFDAFVKGALKDCVGIYSEAVNSLGVALNAYKIRDYETANVRASEVLDAPSDCEDGFKEKAGEKSPVTKVNNNLSVLCAIPLVFTTITK